MRHPRVILPAIWALLVLACAAHDSLAQGTDLGMGTLTVDGAVKRPRQFTAAQLEQLPAQHVDIAYVTDRGQQKAKYTGVLLLTLLEEAGGLSDPERRAALHHTITVTARDGYHVVLSLGELDPDFGDAAALVAYRRDDRPSEPLAGLRLIVPRDKNGGRAVRDVVRLDIK